MTKLAAFASGRGSNFSAIFQHLRDHHLPARYVLVVSDRAHPPVADIALGLGLPFLHLNAKAFPSEEEYAARLIRELESYHVDWITLAGYLKMIPRTVVARFHQRILNIHPALLPLFGGAGMYGEHVHQAVIQAGVKISGATVHLVDEEYDHGPIVLQESVPVHYEDTPEILAQRVLEVEHRLYPRAVELAVTDKLRVHDQKVEILP